jgi:esterase/lipase
MDLFWIVVIIVLIIIAIAIILIGNELLQAKKLFYPLSDYESLPTISYQEVTLKHNIVAWHFNTHPNSSTILYCHGNAGNISYLNNMIQLIDAQGLNCLVFDYRGFGKTPGIPTVNTILRDGKIAYDWLVQRIPSNQIIIWGESLGCAVAIELALNNHCAYLVLAAAFSSLSDLLSDWGNENQFYHLIAKYYHKLNNKDKIERVVVPIVIIHSKDDDIIPYESAVRLYEKIHHDNKLLITVGGNHTAPKIEVEDLRRIFHFCRLTDDGYITCEAESALDRIANDNRRLCPLRTPLRAG